MSITMDRFDAWQDGLVGGPRPVKKDLMDLWLRGYALQIASVDIAPMDVLAATLALRAVIADSSAQALRCWMDAMDAMDGGDPESRAADIRLAMSIAVECVGD